MYMRFKFLSEKLVITDISTQGTSETENELERYVAECRIKTISELALDFWLKRNKDFTHLSPFALYMVCAPASEALCERVFSLCGDLTTSKRNCLSRNLERRAFLKLNAEIIKDL